MAVLLVLLLVFCYVSSKLARFVYRTDGRYLYLAYYILGLIPIRKTILLSDIVDVRIISSFSELRYFLRLNNFPQIWGKLSPYARKVVLRLRRRFYNVIVITPEKVEEFVQELRR